MAQTRTFAQGALEAMERTRTQHHTEAHAGEAHFLCALCHALDSAVVACRTAYNAVLRSRVMPTLTADAPPRAREE